MSAKTFAPPPPPILETPLPPPLPVDDVMPGLPDSPDSPAKGAVGPDSVGNGRDGSSGGKASPATASLSPCDAVEILFKPKPAYTLEAQELHLEGEVLLNVVFLASGGIRLVRVIHGLGHGLDEAAAEAAAHIRFKPARCAGVPIDVSASVHVTFRLTQRQPSA